MIALSPTPTLHTARLTLRAPHLSDAEALAAFWQSPRSLFIGGASSADGAVPSIQHSLGAWALRGYGLWTITLTATGQPIGRTGVLTHADWPEPELAWHLFDGFEGQGLAHEAVLAARSHCHGALQMDPLFSFIHPRNHRSKALAIRLGATLETDTTLQGDTIHIFRHPGGTA